MIETDLIPREISDSFNSTLRKYNPLEYSIRLTSLLNDIFPMQNFNDYSKFDLHKLFNDLYVKSYQSEEVLKFKLFEKLEDKKDMIGAFEIPVADSRVDFVTINGKTTSYEIKSAYDNLSKLNKQINDYSKAFEYNYVVLDIKHQIKAEAILPKNYGIFIFKNGELIRSRRAILNNGIQSIVQLNLLSKKELFQGFKTDKIEYINDKFGAKKINKIFKIILKNRYQEKWQFLINHQKNILPIDIQFFFKTNMNPRDIYYH